MTDYQKLIQKMQSGSKMIRSGRWSVKDYYLDLAEFFDSLSPAKGVDTTIYSGVKHGGYFNFTQDAEDLRILAKREGTDRNTTKK